MITIYKSHSLTKLSKRLSGTIRKMEKRDPFDPIPIIVPNQDTSRWLKLSLAEELGIIGNLRFILPSEWQYQQIRKLYSDLPNKLPSDLDSMKWAIAEILSDPSLRKELALPDYYISSQPDETKEQATVQLAGQLSSVFDQYLNYRPEMILKWQSGNVGSGNENWQGKLWNILNDRWKAKYSNELGINKAELYKNTIQSISRGDILPEDWVSLFNPGLIPAPIVKMLELCGKTSKIDIYKILPANNPDPCKTTEQNELVKAFGDEMRGVSMLFELENSTVIPEYPELKQPENVLQAVRQSIIKNKPVNPFPAERIAQEGIEIHSCHSSLREVETLHQFLIKQFETDPTLQPDDILVMTPDPDRYKQEIHAVFDTVEEGLPYIPYHIGYDRSAEDEELRLSFVRLLELPDSRFSFSSVLDLLSSGPVRLRFGLSESDLVQIKQWMEDNHVIWGLDADHRKDFDQPGESIHTWQSAMKRGWLGQLMGNPDQFFVNDELLYEGIRTTDQRLTWARFSAFLRQLNELRSISKKKRTVGEWSELISFRMKLFLSDESLNSRSGIQLYDIIQNLTESVAISGFRSEVSYTTYRNEIVSAIEQYKASTAIFTRGVTFSSMVPVRSLPFKIVALIGLNESSFPRKPVHPDFDIMAQNPEPFERNRKNEDRNLFLESILSAGNIHYCSYTGQSPKDNETIPPSPIISEWIGILSEMTGIPESEIVDNEALNGFSPNNFTLKNSCSSVYYGVAAAMADQSVSISGFDISQPIQPDENDPIIDVDHLVMFFSNPLRFFLKKRFDVSLTEPKEEKNEFDFNHLERHLLFQRVLGWILNDGLNEAVYNSVLQSGVLPSGWPGKRLFNELIGQAKTAKQELISKNVSPKSVNYEISIPLQNKRIEGSVKSYSNNEYLDINPSAKSGKVLLQSWLRHLLYCTAQNKKSSSLLLCQLKKDSPVWIRFKPIDQSDEILQILAGIYEDGIKEPLYLFPKTQAEYQEAIINNKNKPPEQYAKSEFEGGFKKHGEREDVYITTLIGENTEFRDEFLRGEHQKIVKLMLENSEVLK
ncbi:MAG: exodeoxyribonuclease V subunit gamma [Balneolaceae bacterium]